MLRTHAIARSRWQRLVRPRLVALCLASGVCLTVLTTSAAFGWGHHDKDFRYTSETKARDLLGRWKLRSIAHEGIEDTSRTKAVSYLDIVACGTRYCGIGVSAEETCGAGVLSFEDRGAKFDAFANDGDNEILERFSGSLDLHDKTGRYVVYLDIDDDGEGRRPRYDDTTKLGIVGSSDGSYGRMFPMEMTFTYGGKSVCKAPTS